MVTLFRSWENVFNAIDSSYPTQPAQTLCSRWDTSYKYGNAYSTHVGSQIAEIGNKILFATTCTHYRRRHQAQFRAIFILSALFILPEENRKKMAVCLIDKIAEYKISSETDIEKHRTYVVASLVELLKSFFFVEKVALPLLKLVRHEHYLTRTALIEVDEAQFQNCDSEEFYISIGLLHDLALNDTDLFGWMRLLKVTIEDVNPYIETGYDGEPEYDHKVSIKIDCGSSEKSVWNNLKENCKALKKIYDTYTVAPDGSWTKKIPPIQFTLTNGEIPEHSHHNEPKINAECIECSTIVNDSEPFYYEENWNSFHQKLLDFSDADMEETP